MCGRCISCCEIPEMKGKSKETHFYNSFVVNAAGVVPCGGPKT